MFVTFCFVSFAWIFLRAGGFADASMLVGVIFTSHGSVFMDSNIMLMAAVALVIVFIHDFFAEYKVGIRLLDSRYRVVRYVSAILVIAYILTFGVLNGGSFIYFQF